MTQLEYKDAEALAKKYNIKCIESAYVKSYEEAIKFAGKERIVIKAIPQKPIHKSKSGLVAVGLDSNSIFAAYKSIIASAEKYKPYKVLAQKMVSGGMEIIVGGKIDEQFGRMVLIGLGGIYVEAFKDFSLRVCPISKKDAREMVLELKSSSIIAKDDKALNLVSEILLKVSKMYVKSDLKELDLNPIILHDGTYDAVDLRMIR